MKDVYRKKKRQVMNDEGKVEKAKKEREICQDLFIFHDHIFRTYVESVFFICIIYLEKEY